MALAGLGGTLIIKGFKLQGAHINLLKIRAIEKLIQNSGTYIIEELP